MTVSVELEQILNFALGTPEVGAVNFNILHGLLYEILKHLGIDKKKTEVSDNGSFRSAYAVLNRTGGEPVKDAQTNEKDALKQTLESMPYSGLLESKVSHLESRLKLLDDLPSNDEILKMAKDKRNGKTPVAELWQNINMNRRLGATEQGVEKLSGLLDAMMAEVNEVKDLAGDMDKMKERIAELEKENKLLHQRLSTLEGVDNTEDKENIKRLLKDLEKLRGMVNELPTKEDLKNLDIYVKWPQLEAALNARRTSSPKPKTPPARSPSPPHPSPEAVETLQRIGEVLERHENLKKKVEVLEDEMPHKANKSDLEEFRKKPEIPDDILQQLQSLKDGLEGLQKWKEKKTVPDNIEDQLKALREGVAMLDRHKLKLNSVDEDLQGIKKLMDRLNHLNDKLQLVPDDLLDQLNHLKRTVEQLKDTSTQLQLVPDDLLDQLNELNYLKRTVEQLKEFSLQLPSKLEKLENQLRDEMQKDVRTLRDGLRLLNSQMDKDGNAINAMQNLLLELQSELEKLDATSKELIEEQNRKQKHIDGLYNFSERLQENKADKEYVAMEIDVKADKRSLDNLVSRTKFDQSVGTLDQTLQDAVQRLDGYEGALKETLEKLNMSLDLKLDRLELESLKEYFEKRIKAMKCKHVDSQLNEDPAAGFRKALLRFQCISCDRPVEMLPGPIPPNSSLPLSPGMPLSRAGRPYTTFELDQIRQLNRGMYSTDDGVIPSSRACGGSHTLTYPQRRTARFNQYYYYREDDVPVPLPNRDETELMGQDGHVYKGRLDEQFPDVQQQTSPRPKTPRASSAKRLSGAPSRAASPNAVPRPRSAAPRSPREVVDRETVTAQ